MSLGGYSPFLFALSLSPSLFASFQASSALISFHSVSSCTQASPLIWVYLLFWKGIPLSLKTFLKITKFKGFFTFKEIIPAIFYSKICFLKILYICVHWIDAAGSTNCRFHKNLILETLSYRLERWSENCALYFPMYVLFFCRTRFFFFFIISRPTFYPLFEWFVGRSAYSNFLRFIRSFCEGQPCAIFDAF